MNIQHTVGSFIVQCVQISISISMEMCTNIWNDCQNTVHACMVLPEVKGHPKL